MTSNAPPIAAWGLSGTPKRLPGGHRNLVLRVGDRVLKSTRRSEAALAWLLPVFDLLAKCGPMAPVPLRSVFGTFVVDGWTCEPWHDGQQGKAQDVAAIWPAFAAAAKGLPQRPGFCASVDLQTVTQGGDIDLGDMPGTLTHAIRAAWAALDATPQTVVHADLSPSNILRATDGQLIVLDWDEARIDHPGFDRAALGQGNDIEHRAAVAWEIACCWYLEPARARALAARFMNASC